MKAVSSHSTFAARNSDGMLIVSLPSGRECHPFYVLGDGPPQVIVGRYADVHEVFSDADRFRIASAERTCL